MNKEEIKKATKVVFYEKCKECYFPKRKCASCVREEKKKIKKHIKYLEQKSETLDKVTDKLKELDFRLYLQREEDSASGKDINTIINVRLDLDKILNIIEGEKK